MSTYILGISCFYHDSAATLLKDGEIISAVQEERFTRIKHDPSFPSNSIDYCLRSAGIKISDVSFITYYEKPLLTFSRLIHTYIQTSPKGFRSFRFAMKAWLTKKLFIKRIILKELTDLNDGYFPKHLKHSVLFSQHHLSHAASAFYPSPYKEAVILCMDGVGEWATSSAWIGSDNKIRPLWQINFPHSLGLFYSAFTSYCGFKVNSGEYKLMGLAPYGKPVYKQLIIDNMINISHDGSFRLNMEYFSYHFGFSMYTDSFCDLFNHPPRNKESEITQFYMDVAASIQAVVEDVILLICRNLREISGIDNICLSGGVALNCVANGKILADKTFSNVWIQPASGDAGSSLGSALATWHLHLNNDRYVSCADSMKGTYLGPEFSNDDIINYLGQINAPFHTHNDPELFECLAEELEKGHVIGWFNGPMEFGPRALGGRSIIGDPRNQKMQSVMNLKIKYRESFRPFAPSILEEDVSNQFEMNAKSPYMLLVAPVKKELCKQMTEEEDKLFGIEKLNIPRSSLPAITHVDYSARVQTVSASTNPRYHNLISAFKRRTGCPTIVNTSFNVRGEPIVCTPQDAYRCFMRTEMDVLVLQNQILFKSEQPNVEKNETWMQEFELD